MRLTRIRLEDEIRAFAFAPLLQLRDQGLGLTRVDGSVGVTVMNLNGRHLLEPALERRSERRTEEIDDAPEGHTGARDKAEREREVAAQGESDDRQTSRVEPGVTAHERQRVDARPLPRGVVRGNRS